MQRQGVITRPMGGYKLPEWIRITIGTPTENQRCIEALTETRLIGRALDNRLGGFVIAQALRRAAAALEDTASEVRVAAAQAIFAHMEERRAAAAYAPEDKESP